MTLTLGVFFLFMLKHFTAEFLMQSPYMYLNKGTYGHFGGILHALIHGFLTVLILRGHPLLFFSDAVLAGLIDMMVHYHIDWAKVSINEKFGWKSNTSDKFWILMGFDQFLHMLTYIGIMAYFGLG
jgi:hypothetical protein